MKPQTIILTISEEYGYRHWYAVLSEQQFAQLQKDWQTIKGLSCIVPVQFLIPQARPLWALPVTPEHQIYLTQNGLAEHNVRIRGAHIHQSDDSGLAGVAYDIPEQEEFEFLGKTYTHDEVSALFNEYSNRESREFYRYSSADPKLADDPVMFPEAWDSYSGNVPKLEISEIFVWPEDQPLPAGFTRTEDGKIVKEPQDD